MALKVINLFGQPGAGKSTTATGLFHFMKLEGINCEYVSEYAKDRTWERHHSALEDQLYIFGKQQRRLSRLVGQVEWAITDSPIMLGLIYTRPDYYPNHFRGLVREAFDSYENHNFYIRRVKPYNPAGRNQTEAESDQKGNEIIDLITAENLPFQPVDGDRDAPKNILRILGLVDHP